MNIVMDDTAGLFISWPNKAKTNKKRLQKQIVIVTSGPYRTVPSLFHEWMLMSLTQSCFGLLNGLVIS